MDNLVLLNGVGIVVMAIFGLWVFYRSAQMTRKQRPPKDEEHKND